VLESPFCACDSFSCDRVGWSAREAVYRIGEQVVGLVGVGSAGGNQRCDPLQGGNQQQAQAFGVARRKHLSLVPLPNEIADRAQKANSALWQSRVLSVGLDSEHEVEQGAIMNCESYVGGGRRPQPCPVVRAGVLDSRAHLVGETGESGFGQGVQ